MSCVKNGTYVHYLWVLYAKKVCASVFSQSTLKVTVTNKSAKPSFKNAPKLLGNSENKSFIFEDFQTFNSCQGLDNKDKNTYSQD